MALQKNTFASILPFRKKTEEVAKDAQPVEEKTPLEDFIPYHTHYNTHTLLTKNGELMQTIKITTNNDGLDYETGEGEGGTVREMIRRAILASLKNDQFSVWVHTLRKRKKVMYRAEFKEAFAAYVHEGWQDKHPWKYQYYNEIYVTILFDGQSAVLIDKKFLRQLALPKKNRTFRNTYLDQAYETLDATVSQMLSTIKAHYNARRLSLVERISTRYNNQPIFYSEPMEFLGTLLNLRDRSYTLPEADISTVIRPHTLTFGFSALEAKNQAGRKRFAGMLTLKQYREMPPEVADRILQAPIELIVSQSFVFTPSQDALKEYKEQRELFQMSEDAYSMQATGLEEMIASNHQLPTDFGEHQTTIMVIADEFRSLDNEMGKLQTALGEVGLIAIREDIKLEEAYWAQLPGDFEFTRRREFISTGRVAGLTRLNRFPGGQPTGNHWGDAVALLPTTVNSPYFFNFHHHDNGHTVVYDFNSFNDSAGRILLNFLLTSTRKFNGRTIIFDRHMATHLLCDKLDGSYQSFTGDNRVSLNPFTLPDSPRNRGFLLAWVGSLLAASVEFGDERKTLVRHAIDQIYSAPAGERHLPALITLIAAADSDLGNAFATWHGSGVYSGIFDPARKQAAMQHSFQVFDMDSVVAHHPCITPVFSYLLHCVVTNLDGKPTVIVIHDAWDMLENAFFAPRLESLLEMLKQNNTLVIFTTSTPADCPQTYTYAALKKSCGTHIYVPDDIALDYEGQAVGLSAFESHILRKMDRQKGHFLLKQQHETLGLVINLDQMDDVHSIFASDIKNLIAAGGPYATLPRMD